MKFSEAYLEMLKGNKITRPCFKGYWYCLCCPIWGRTVSGFGRECSCLKN